MEEVEGHLGLDEGDISKVFWKGGIDTGEYGQEVGFEGLDSLFSRVFSVQVGGYKLKCDSLATHIILEAS